MKKRTKVGLLIWSAGEHYWGGWQGFTGLYGNKVKATERLYSEKNRQNNKAQMFDFGSLRVLATYEKRDGKWLEVKGKS